MRTRFSAWGFVLSGWVGLGLLTCTGFKARADVARPTYTGPLIIFAFDRDLTLTADNGEFFRVFLWPETGTPFRDSAQLPETIDIPMRDWEVGVPSEVQQYNYTPIKALVGRYVDRSRRIHYPGNSYYDLPIQLSNGVSFNPRFYYQEDDRTNMNFRTDLANGLKPLVAFTKVMAKTKKVGPAWPLFQLSTRADFPAFSTIITMAGNQQIEWDESQKILKRANLLSDDATIDRIYAINNPRLSLFDTTSTSTFGRADKNGYGKKIEILEYTIDNILSRRIDRDPNPRPNVLVYADDNIEIVRRVKELFERKVRAVQDYDRNMRRAQPPLRLILWNLAPPELYGPVPNALMANPSALANKPVDVEQIMVFDSNYRYNPGQSSMVGYSSPEPDTKALSLALDIPNTLARQALTGEIDCTRLLRRMGTKRTKR